MPGRLMAEFDNGNQTLESQERKGSSVSNVTPAAAVNGIIGAHLYSEPAKIPHANGESVSPSGQAIIPASLGQKLKQLPPEIPHILEGYQSLSKLFERASQECFNSLTEVITELGEDAPEPQVNGNGINGSENTSPSSAKRRLRWMNFANSSREKFLKLFVLSQWSRQAGDVSKLVDLHVWADRQLVQYEDCEWAMGDVKRNLHDARLMRPDVKTALEILSTGKSAKMPDLEYIRPKPLSPQTLLKTLKNLNTLLAIRLNLHETLPRHFQNFRIASGRATFSVPLEFEVDLSIASEDASTPLYFIDFRFLFNTTSEIPAGQIRGELKWRANAVLASDGLAGLYSFLHDFVLTHKINILRRQAIEMAKTSWAGSIRIEQVHRSLIVQYWIDRPGPKSWIEIGVVSGEDDAPSWREARQSQLAVKWMRGGKEVKEAAIPIDVDDLSMQKILKYTVSRHIESVLSSIYMEYRDSISAADVELPSVSFNAKDANESELRIPLTESSSAVLLMEPVRGQFALRPLTASSTRCLEALNALKDPAREACVRLRNWKASELQQSAVKEAKRSGWEVLGNINWAAEIVKQHFGPRVLRLTCFRGRHWHQVKWVVAETISSDGDSWWIVQLPEGASDNITSAQRLPTSDGKGNRLQVSRSFFADLERLAVCMVSFFVLSQQLKQLRIPHAINYPPVFQPSSLPTVLIKLPALLKDSRPSKNSKSSLWTMDLINLSYRGLVSENVTKDSRRDVVHVIKGTMSQSASLFRLLRKAKVPDIAFDKSGAFAILLKSPLGTGFLDQIVAKLNSLSRLRSRLETIERARLKCKAATLERIAFECPTVEQDDPSKITVGIVHRPNSRTELAFHPPHQNPFNRISILLARLLNTHSVDSASTLAAFIKVLKFTRPLLSTCSKLESHDPAATSLFIHAHALDAYTILYSRPPCAFDLRLRAHKGTPTWLIHDTSALRNPNSKKSQPFKDDLTTLYSSAGTGWTGLRYSIVASTTGVAAALLRLDETVRAHAADALAEDEAPEPGKPAHLTNGTAAPVVQSAAAAGPAGLLDRPPQPLHSKPLLPNHAGENARPLQQLQNNGRNGASQKRDVVVID